jgi:hypothetical protein
MNLPSVQYSYANANIAYDVRNVYNNAVQLPCRNLDLQDFEKMVDAPGRVV